MRRATGGSLCAARREAERGAYDPTYGGYFLGKRGLLALRDDYARQHGAPLACASFTSAS